MNTGKVTQTSRVHIPEVTAAKAEAPAAPKLPLLPAPTALGEACLEDGAALLLKLTMDANRRQTDADKADIVAASGQRELQMKEVEKKFQDWLANQNNPMHWLTDVFKAVGIALSSVASVMTCGALSGVLAGAVALSVGAFVVEKTEMFGPEVSKIVATVMGATAAVAGGIANLAASGGAAASKLAETAAGKVLSKVSEASESILSIGEDAAHIADAVHIHNQEMREADVKEQRNRLEQIRRTIGLLIEGLKNLNASQRRAVETVNDTIRVTCETGAMLAAGTRV